MPVIVANKVSSLPRPTLMPGLCRVPRCRIKIVPAFTSCPPKRFTPSRCPCESRPFVDDPPPFLCAMTHSLFSFVTQANPAEPVAQAWFLGLRLFADALQLRHPPTKTPWCHPEATRRG